MPQTLNRVCLEVDRQQDGKRLSLIWFGDDNTVEVSQFKPGTRGLLEYIFKGTLAEFKADAKPNGHMLSGITVKLFLDLIKRGTK